MIRRAEKRIRHLEHELACAPAFIRKAYPAVWHYQVEHHEAHGRLDLRIELIEPVRGDTVEAFGVEAETSHHDSTVLRPNPEIGLAADPLMLPDRDRITADLVESAAERAAGRLIAAVARAHADHWLRIAAGHADLGDAAAATEARVAAAVVLEPSDPNRAQRMLDELR